MKIIYEGYIRIVTEEDDGKFTATIEYNNDGIISKETNREYAALAEVMNKFKKEIIQKVNI